MIIITTNCDAQLFSVGAGGARAISQEVYGVNIKTYANSGHALTFGPEVTFYPKQTVERGALDVDVTLLDLNIMAHFNFYPTDVVGFYALGGFNYTIQNEKFNNIEVDNSSLGPRLGLGIQFVKTNFAPFVEFSHIFGPINENTISAGILYTFKKVAKEVEIELDE